MNEEILFPMFASDDFNTIYLALAESLFHNGQVVSPRDQSTLELTNATFHLFDPTKSIITIPERKFSKKYLLAELKWYESGDRNIKDIKDYATIWSQICDENEEINSNYGAFVFHDKMKNGKTQIEWCYDKLKNDPDSRQAVINYNDHSHKYDNNKDFVCTIAQQFIIRDNVLNCTVMARSNDFIYGLPYDVPWFTHVQISLAKKLNIKVGTYTHFVTSLHVYERHFKLLGEISNVYHQPN